MIDLNIITQAEIQNFIIDNTNTDLTQFLLKTNPFPNLSIQEIAQQIKGRQIAQKKFPFLLKIPQLMVKICKVQHLNNVLYGLFQKHH